jgi:beta-N-acetylhexosaminidase
MKVCYLILTWAVVTSSSWTQAQAPHSQIQATPLITTPNGDMWVEQTLKHLSLEEKVGQMLQVRIYADYQDLSNPEYLYIRDEIRKYHIGSVDLDARMVGPNLVKASPLQVATTLNQLQSDSELPLLVGADIERGLASRVSQVPEFPFPMAFGAIAAPGLVEQFGAIVAIEARAVGIHWAFGPVADVNSNPANPIINTRSFGEDPHQVASLVAAYIRGAHQNGMVVAVKHFPGQGDTATDPHVRVTRIEADRDHLNRYEFPPFVAAISAGADSVMLAQASAPALDADETRIATTSPKIVDGVLRKDLGFQGLVLTDALEMRGLMGLYPLDVNPSAKIAVDAVKAGDDVLMLPRNLDAAFSGIVAAVRSGEIPESRIDASVRRILRMKAAVGLDESRFVDLDHLRSVFSGPDSAEFAQHISDSAVTLVRSNGSVLPLTASPTGASIPQGGVARTASKDHKLVVITFTDSRGSRLGPTFEKELKLHRPDAEVFHYFNDHSGSEAVASEVLSAAKFADEVVVAAFMTHATGRQVASRGIVKTVVGLSGGGAQLLADIVNANPAKAVVIALGSPYLIEDYPQIQNYICTYSLTPTGEVSAVRALFGEIQNHAKLPVTLPGVADINSSVPWPKPLKTIP